ncbi:hypothetical protein MKX08_008171 [Trichoderma sp. CBMAI-0020]|nr:hypothetical protein MKX08_008171 [Trichoderma sp. CBMAI-0020]
MKHRISTPPAASLLELQSGYMSFFGSFERENCHACLHTESENKGGEQTSNPIWNNQPNGPGGDPTARDVGSSQIPSVPAASYAESFHSIDFLSSTFTPSKLAKFESESESTLTEPEPEMTTSKAGLEKPSQLLAASLWGEAYDDLKSQEPNRLKRYEDTMKLWLEGDPETSMLYQLSVKRPLGDGLAVNPLQWKQSISGIVATCLNMNPDDDGPTEANDNKQPESQPGVRAIMHSTRHSVPNSVLPWVGMWLCLQYLGYHESKSEKVISGMSHVLSRLPWYGLLPRLLDREGEGSAQGRLLRGRIRELYKAILFYQIRLVCSQQNEDSQISPAEANHDLPFNNATDLNVTEIVNAEKALECFLGACIENQIRIYIHSHIGQRDATAVDHKQKDSPMINDDIRVDMLLGDLSAVDRQQHHRGVRSARTKALIPLYEKLYQWISSLHEYKLFEANQVRMLWIIGTPGTGKSICLSAIMWAYARREDKTFPPLLLSFSRNGNGQQKPENAASAIKSLIYAILKEQSCLVHLLFDGLKHIGRGHLSHANDFYALFLILKKMVQDKRFQPTLILIDGVDEIQGDDGTEFNRFFKLMRTTMSISSKIKWLLSADTLPLSDKSSMGRYISLDQNYFRNMAIFNAYYIPFKVGEVALYGNYDEQLRLQLTESLRSLSLGNFFWADVVCEFIIQTDSWHARHILQELLDYRKSVNPNVCPYSFMIDNINKLPFGDNNYCLKILGAMAETYYPIKLAELRVLVNLPPEVNIERLITTRCFSFLELCCGSVCFTHRSARDFYVGHVNESSAQRHRWIVKNCLLFLSGLLNLPSGDYLHQQRATNSTIPPYYPTVCWIQHLVHVIDDKEIRDQAIDVMTEKFFKWTDILVSLGGLSRACCLMLDLEAHLKKELEDRIKYDEDDFHIFQLQNYISHVCEARKFLNFHKSMETPAIFGAKTFGGSIHHMAISSRGLIAVSNGNKIHIWNFDDGHRQQARSSTTLDDFARRTVSFISFSNDGCRLAAAVGAQIKIWDISTYSIIVSQDVAYQNSLVSGLAFSNNDALLASASGNRVSLWKLTEEPAHNVNNEHLGLAFRVAFSPNRKHIATIAGDVIHIWDLRSRRKPNVLIGHESGINAIAFSPDGSCLASASMDGTVRIWGGPWDDEHKQAQLILRGHSSQVNNLSFSPLESEKYVVSCSGDHTLCIWDYSRHEVKAAAGASIEVSGEVDQQVSGHKTPISCLALSRDGKVVASGSKDGLICLWDEDLGSFRGQAYGHCDEILSLEFSHDSRYLLSSSQDRTVRVWDVKNRLQPLLVQHTDWVRSAVFSPDGNFVASGCDDRMVRVWDMQRLVDESNNGASNDGIIYNYRHKLRGHTSFVMSVVFSKDGRYIAAGSHDGRVIYWDLLLQEPGSGAIQSMKVLMQGQRDIEIISLIFNSDASSLIACSSSQIWIWDTATGQQATAKCSVPLHTLQLNPAYPGYVVTGVGPILIKDIQEFDLVHTTPTTWCPYSFTNFVNRFPKGIAYHIPGGIAWQGKQVIFLPKLYRGGIAQVRDHSVIVGCESGRLLFFRFKEDASFDDWP